MATKTQYVEYTIHLTDKAQVAALQAQYPDGIRKAPAQAAIDYSAPVQVVSQEFDPPCTRSPVFIIPVLLPSSLTNYPRHLATWTRKSGGWFGLSFLFGTTTTFIWVGKFAYAAEEAEIDGAPQEAVAIAKRLWMIGFESSSVSGEHAEMVSSGGNSDKVCREASRYVDGLGFVIASGSSEYAADRSASGTADSNKTWERFRFNLSAAPNVNTRFWRCHVGGGANRGAALYMTPDRRIVCTNISDAGAETVQATSSMQFELGRWYRLDLLLESLANASSIQVFINRSAAMTVGFPTGIGMNAGGNHDTSWIGAGGAPATNTIVLFIDDWIGAEWPTEDSNGDYVGKDWLNGSRVRMIPATAFAAGNDWAGDYRYANMAPHQAGQPTGTSMTSSTSGHALRLAMSSPHIEACPGAIGVVAFMVYARGRNLLSGQGTLGWKRNGVIDLAAQVQSTAGGAEGGNNYFTYRRWYCPSGLIDPIPNAEMVPFEVHKVKALDANAADYTGVGLVVEMIGTFGDEDSVATEETAEPTTNEPEIGKHNAPYPETRWARGTIAPASPVIIHTGTYVGNGTAQELVFRSNVNFLMIQQRSGGVSQYGGMWWSSMISPHMHAGAGLGGSPVEIIVDPNFAPVDGEDNQEQRVVVRIVGSAAETNQVGVTYQYFAFMDPGSRYSVNENFVAMFDAYNPVGSRDLTFPRHSTFLPEWVFVQEEAMGVGGGASARWTKGPGHAANGATATDGANNFANALSVTAGGYTVRPNLMFTGANRVGAISAWRDDDLSDDANKHNVLKIGTYTGDGTASRTITFATSGKRPVYGIVQPVAAAPAWHRTPADTATNSTPMAGVPAATGITGGGIDSFTVGSSLNANGVVYNYIMWLGSATAGNNGWSIDGEFTVVEPDSPDDGDWDPGDDSDPPAPEPVDPTEPVEPPDDDDDCADGTFCVEATTRIVNLALLEIGVDKILTNYCTSDTREAKVAQEVYEQCVRHTLITYPWPFATKYASLALTASQPSNQDWTYSYRMPSDCIFPRRIVVARGTAVDPAPPPMGLSSDGSGGIILANEQNAILEYTARPACVGFNGDDLFREALKWRLAAAMAPALTRIGGEAERCLKMFEIIVQKAESVVKQGVPGLRAGSSTLDTTQAALDANVQVVNMALVRIGSRTIRNMTTEQSREAVAAALVFEDTLRSVLRDFPWSFATRYVDPLTWVEGSEGDPASPDWTYAHRLPTDFVFLRRVVTEGTGRSFDPNPYPFRLSSDDTGGLLYSNVEEPVVEYTARLQNIMLKADVLFRDALAWKLAATLAPSLASIDPNRPEQHGRGPETPQDPTERKRRHFADQQRRIATAQWAEVMYNRELQAAAAADRNESQPEPDGLPDWLRAR